MTEKNKSILLILLTSVLGAGMAPFSKLALMEISPGFFSLLRFLLAASVLLPVFFYKKFKLNWADAKILIPISLLAATNIILFIFGLRLTAAGNSQILYAAVPLVVSVVSYFLINEKLPTKKLAGLALGFIGLVLVVLAPAIDKISFSRQSLLGNLLILLGVITFSFYTVLSKKLHNRYSPFILTLAFVITSALTLLALLPFEKPDFSKSISPHNILILMYVGIVGTAVYYVIYQKAIKIATPIIASAILYLQPIFAVILSSFLLGEKLTLTLLFGAIVVFAGTGLLTYSKQ